MTELPGIVRGTVGDWGRTREKSYATALDDGVKEMKTMGKH
jgi:hypothetical protein